MKKFIIAFKNKKRKVGFRKALIHCIKKVTGRLKIEREIDSLYYIVNHYFDITKIPPASGSLRKLQLCDAVMLSIFDAICRKHNWTYWLAYGTLLGAVRHKGFIPWDDDLDVCMPRECYDVMKKKLSEILASYGDDKLTFRWGGGGILLL